MSNALGTITPAKQMVEMAHRHGARVLVDGAQAVSHMRVDVQALDCDFYVFSGHKMFGPTGIGAVYGRARCSTPRLPAGLIFAAWSTMRRFSRSSPRRRSCGPG